MLSNEAQHKHKQAMKIILENTYNSGLSGFGPGREYYRLGRGIVEVSPNGEPTTTLYPHRVYGPEDEKNYAERVLRAYTEHGIGAMVGTDRICRVEE